MARLLKLALEQRPEQVMKPGLRQGLEQLLR